MVQRKYFRKLLRRKGFIRERRKKKNSAPPSPSFNVTADFMI